jgi:uncharacterized protein (TIGR04141 family)
VALWQFWECLHHELRQAGHKIVLDGGRWYRVGQHFANQVEQFTQGLESSGIALPVALRGEAEGKYNERAATSTGISSLIGSLYA